MAADDARRQPRGKAGTFDEMLDLRQKYRAAADNLVAAKLGPLQAGVAYIKD